MCQSRMRWLHAASYTLIRLAWVTPPPQAAGHVRGYKGLIQECPFAPYFETASGVGRFRGPGGCVAGAGRPQGCGFSASRNLSTLLGHISLRYDELNSYIDQFTLQFATPAREGRTCCAACFDSLIKKQGSPRAVFGLDGHLDFTFSTLVRLVCLSGLSRTFPGPELETPSGIPGSPGESCRSNEPLQRRECEG